MAWFNVKVELQQESVFDVELEADSVEEAEELVKTNLWNDKYTHEIRATLEITDEYYDAIEMCDECNAEIDYCICEEDDDDNA